MADIADRAQQQSEISLQQYNRARRIRECSAGESAFVCEICEEPIPEARREAVPGCRFCVTCQMELESRQ